MELKKCSFKEHSESNAIIYCVECKIYMCNKCEKHHSNLFINHHQYNLEKNINEIFTGFCMKDNHFIELKYFCKSHNELVCPACIAKIKGEGFGQHFECDVCLIKDIKEEKRNKLKENILMLENLSKTLDKSINELKLIFEKINKNKEELIINVQKIFTKIRNILNEREEKLILEIDDRFNEIYFEEDIIKNSEKLPKKVKISLENGKLIDKEWKDNELNSMVNDCIDIEKNIQYVNEINNNINNFNSNNKMKIELFPKEDGINEFIEKVRTFGKISSVFKFKKCPSNAKDCFKYTVSGENENIFTKNGTQGYWTAGLCEYELKKSKEYKWKIKILKSSNKYIMVGVAPIDFDINKNDHDNYGWYMYCWNSNLYSGPPYKYSNKSANLSGVKDEVIISMNMSKRTLKFIINNEDKGDSYVDIPIEKPIVPAVIIYDLNDSVEINEC